MSERAAVLHITLKALAKVEDLEDGSGARVQIIDKPTYRTDMTLVGQGGTNELPKDKIDQLSVILEYAVAQLFAKSMKVPDNIEQVNSLHEMLDTKGAVN